MEKIFYVYLVLMAFSALFFHQAQEIRERKKGRVFA